MYKVLNRIAKGTYRGLGRVGKKVLAPVDNYLKKMENMDNEKMKKNIEIINENFGSVDNYLKQQETKKKKLK